MATAAEVERALRLLVDRLDGVDPEVRRRTLVDRTVSCTVEDLGVTWSGRLCQDGLRDLAGTTRGQAETEVQRAQIRLAMTSDDLLALSDGRLPVPLAWASGRLRVQAAPLDLLKLRALL